MKIPSVAICTVAIAINEWGEWVAVGSSNQPKYEIVEDAHSILNASASFISDNVQTHWVEVELPFPTVAKGVVLSE
jgi:hypothetical protein